MIRKIGMIIANARIPPKGNNQSPQNPAITNGKLANISGISGTPHNMAGRVQPL